MGEREQGLRSVLWSMDGAWYGRVDVRFGGDGALEVRRHEMGAGPRAAWGEDDHEASLSLAPDAVARLAMALLIERHGGDADALEALRDFCEAHDIPARRRVWT